MRYPVRGTSDRPLALEQARDPTPQSRELKRVTHTAEGARLLVRYRVRGASDSPLAEPALMSCAWLHDGRLVQGPLF